MSSTGTCFCSCPLYPRMRIILICMGGACTHCRKSFWPCAASWARRKHVAVVVAEQAAELERLQREVVRLRAAVIVRDTQLGRPAALEDARQASRLARPGARTWPATFACWQNAWPASRANACAGGCRPPCRRFLSLPRQDEAVAPAAHPCPHTSHPCPGRKPGCGRPGDLPDRLHQPRRLLARARPLPPPASPAFWWTRRHCLVQRRALASPWWCCAWRVVGVPRCPARAACSAGLIAKTASGAFAISAAAILLIVVGLIVKRLGRLGRRWLTPDPRNITLPSHPCPRFPTTPPHCRSMPRAFWSWRRAPCSSCFPASARACSWSIAPAASCG